MRARSTAGLVVAACLATTPPVPAAAQSCGGPLQPRCANPAQSMRLEFLRSNKAAIDDLLSSDEPLRPDQMELRQGLLRAFQAQRDITLLRGRETPGVLIGREGIQLKIIDRDSGQLATVTALAENTRAVVANVAGRNQALILSTQSGTPELYVGTRRFVPEPERGPRGELVFSSGSVKVTILRNPDGSIEKVDDSGVVDLFR